MLSKNAEKLTLVVLTVSALLCLAEVTTRIFLPYQSLAVLTGREAGQNPMAGYQCADAYSAFRPRPSRSISVDGKPKTTNDQGFVSTPETAPTRPPELLRVAFLGGSTTFSTVADEQAWPTLVMSNLRDRFPGQRFDFLNAGNVGWTTFESYGFLWSRIRFYRPDIVVVMHAWNDLKTFHPHKVDEMHMRLRGATGCWDFENLPEPVEWYHPSLLDPLIGWSQFLTSLRIHLSAQVAGVERRGTAHVDTVHSDLAETYDQRGVDIYGENIRLMKSTTEMWGGVLFAVKQPTLIVHGQSEAMTARRIAYHLTGFTHDTLALVFGAIYRALDRELPNRTIDAASVMNGVAEDFQDHVHMTTTGHRRLAGIVSKRLAQHLTTGSLPTSRPE
jgi:hypothetical protein